LQPEAEPIKEVHVSDKGYFGFARLNHKDANTESLGYVIPARVLGGVLHKDLSALQGIEVLRPAELTHFHRTDGIFQLDLAGLDEQVASIKTRLLVAADGDRSLIREQGGFSTREWHYAQTAVVCNVQTALPHQQVAYERFAGNGPLAMLPMNNHRSAMVWTVAESAAEAVMQMDDTEFMTETQRLFGFRLGRFQRIGKRGSYKLSMSLVESPAKDGVILLGNAAHTLHPVAGQGFNLGLRDVSVLHELLSQQQTGSASIGAEQMMQTYLDKRQRDLRVTGLATDMLVRMFSNPLSVVKVVRNTALLGLDCLPGLRKGVARAGMGLLGKQSPLNRGIHNET